MCRILARTKDMPRKEWLRLRREGIGGSDAGSICGLNPYSSPMAVYQDKTSEEIVDVDNEAMRQGRDFEDYVAERFMESAGKKVRRANVMYQSTEYPFMFANVDRMVVGEDAGLECKTASAYSADKWKDGHIPESYQLQCYHYMAVTGAEAWYIAVVILGREFIWHRIERDEELIQNLISIESDFWNNHVVPRIMPEPDGSESSEQLIREYFGNPEADKIIPLTGFDEQLKRRGEITALMNKLDTEKKTIEQKLKVFMGDAEIAENEKYRVSWKSNITNRLDSKALKQDYPDIYRKYEKTTNCRRFLVKDVVA
ncbi:MAG: YqaJ viral recombinase family protein [Eubacterium sp.]|nr:YqaJ viral recombinase family protein [Eubacterium sp.]